MTKYEKEILNIINSSYDHLNAEQVFSKLKEKYPAVVLATVYNNLNKLKEAELIRKITVEGLPDRYDRIIRHDHMVCKGCGKLKDVNFDDLTSSLRQHFGEDILSYDLQVYYLCSECKNKNF